MLDVLDWDEGLETLFTNEVVLLFSKIGEEVLVELREIEVF